VERVAEISIASSCLHAFMVKTYCVDFTVASHAEDQSS
jgi:hypothetical protein